MMEKVILNDHNPKNKFNKVYRTVQELKIRAFTKHTSRRFTELFKIKCGTFNHFS